MLEHAVANVAVEPLVLLAAVIGAGTAVNLLKSFSGSLVSTIYLQFMNLHLVPVEICRGGKSLATLRALVGLLSRVRVGVIFQQKSLRESLVTDSTNVLANRRVKLLVLAEIMHQEPTLGALLPPVHLDLLVKLVLDRLFNFDRQQLHRSVGHV